MCLLYVMIGIESFNINPLDIVDLLIAFYL